MSLEKTQEILEKIIKQPQLTEKLLSRPPFKFIVEIVKNIIAATGYLENDLSEKEIENASNDKDTKRYFLVKLIKLLDDGSLKSIKVTEILAGRDAEGANKVLQKLGTNASNFSKNGGAEEVKKKKRSKKEDGKSDDKTSSKKRSSRKDDDTDRKSKKRSSSEKPEKPKSRHSSEEPRKKSSSSKDRHTSKERKNESSGHETSKKSSEKSSEKKSKKKTEENGTPKKSSKKAPSERHLKRQDSMIAVNGDAPDTPTNDNESPTEEIYEDQDRSINSGAINDESSMNSHSIQSENLTLNDGVGRNALLLKPEDQMPLVRPMTGAAGGRPMTSMGRPGTAASRPAPPKLKKKQIATTNAAPQLVIELQSNIINDAFPDIVTEDDDNFIIENNEEDEEKTARVSDFVDEEDRGALVQKIMETKAEIEDSATLDHDKNIDKVTPMENEKVKQLQEKLQDLTKSAYPLARLFDFASDDIESMVKELERWRSDQKKNEQEEQSKQSTGFGDSSRLYNVIANLQKEIDDMKEELSKARGRVLNNENRIELFVSNI